MQSRQKLNFERITRLLRLLDARASLSLLGLAAGALGGAAYTLQSASHMVLPAPSDLYVLMLMLAALGAVAGWLVGVLLKAPLSGGGQPDQGEVAAGGVATEAQPASPSPHGTE